MSSVRAVGASLENASALRDVRNFSNEASSCAHAARSKSRSAAEGASGAGALAETEGGVAGDDEGVAESGRELDS